MEDPGDSHCSISLRCHWGGEVQEGISWPVAGGNPSSVIHVPFTEIESQTVECCVKKEKEMRDALTNHFIVQMHIHVII